MKQASNEIKILGAKGNTIGSIRVDIPKSHFIKSASIPTARVHQSKKILAFEEVKPMFRYLGYSQQEVAEVLEVNPSTLSRWDKNEKSIPIGKLRSKTLFDIDHIIAKGVRIFGSEDNFKHWLNTPNYALGDVKPIELLKDPYGVEVVDNAMEAMSWGNFI
jgi:putative toxin-antitoxin system antitoxin component (TIGR02293 family)